MRISSLKHVAIAVLLLACAGCEFHGLTCWNRLKILNIEMSVILEETRGVDASNFADIRSRIASNVESCRSGDFYRDLDVGAVGGGEYYFTLFDFAVMANDVALTAEMHERHLELSPEFREEKLIIGDSHLNTALYVESDAVVRWMLANGYDADAPDERGVTPIFYSKTRTDEGLRATRDLVANGADPAYEGPDGITPLMNAWRQGNLRKVQCLIALGAEIPEPLPMMEEPRSPFVDPYDVARVTAFLSNADRTVPGHIAEICSIDP